jgi:hypothetical protein
LHVFAAYADPSIIFVGAGAEFTLAWGKVVSRWAVLKRNRLVFEPASSVGIACVPAALAEKATAILESVLTTFRKRVSNDASFTDWC